MENPGEAQVTDIATEVFCPELHKYVIELADGSIFRPIATSATHAMEQAERAYPKVAVTGCREVER